MKLPIDALPMLATGTALAASVCAFPFLPQRVATHFRSDGHPDRHRGRISAVFALPATMLFVAGLSKFAGAWPGASDREDADSGARAREQAIGIAELGLMANHFMLLAYGLSLPVDMERVPRAIFGAMLLGLGNVLPKVPRNALVGIRTPWTLSDPTVWERTHRVGGYLCVLSGLLTLASAPVRTPVSRRLPIAITLASVSLTAGYSWLLHRQRTAQR